MLIDGKDPQLIDQRWLIMQEQQTILKPVAFSTKPSSPHQITRSRCGILSLFLLGTLLFGIYQWYTALQAYLQARDLSQLDHYQLKQIIELNHTHSFQETVLKYKLYLTVTCGFVQPNILLSLCILISFPLVILSIQRETCTPIAFYQYTGISIYMQIIRLGLDGVQYLLTGRCYCLNSGAAAVWLNLMTKILFYRLPYLCQRPLSMFAITVTYLVSFGMVILKGRIDLCVGVVVGIIELWLMQGGTIKYPKEVFQQKQNWMEKIKINRLRIWHPFRWNDYRQNHLMCLDSEQFYIFKAERMILFQ